MSQRGNDRASVGVRAHGGLAALLALASALALLASVAGAWDARDAWDDETFLSFALVALLGALTLVVQAVAFWYVPSFAKRALRGRGVARAAPWLVAGGVLALALVFFAGPPPGAPWLFAVAAALGLSLGVGSTGLVVVASVAWGRPWRGGVPFWRSGGAHEPGDRIAAGLLLAGAIASLLGGAAGLAALANLAWSALVGGPDSEVLLVVAACAWFASLFLFVGGALAHLVPRARGAPLMPRTALAGALLLASGLLVAPFAVASPPGTLVAGVPRAALLLGVACLFLALRGEEPPHKRPGPRMREARAHLVGAAVAGFLGASGLFAHPRFQGIDLFLGLTLALLLATEALSVLALPVVFNQRPARRHLPLAAGLPLLAALLARLGVGVRHDQGGDDLVAFSAILVAVGVLLWVLALWPLRQPRRACPPGDAEGS